MHRIESDNVIVDSDGKNQFTDGPPGTTVNDDFLNSVQEELCNAIEGFGKNLGTKANDSKDQLYQVLNALRSGTTRAATYVFASSDSETDSQNGADAIILESADAAVTINSKISELDGLGGGIILFLEGTYNCSTSIINAAAYSNISLVGSGFRTIFKRAANFQNVIDVSSCTFCIFRDFQIDGNGASYDSGGVDSCGILGKSGDSTNRFINITSHDNEYHFTGAASGFIDCENMEGCIAYDNAEDGFSECYHLINCYSYGNTRYGFGKSSVGSETRGSHISCIAYNNGVDGFYGVAHLTGCYSYGNTRYGFGYCRGVVSCFAYNNTDTGFNNCDRGAGNKSINNGESGFENCEQLSSCFSNGNSLHGFQACDGLSQCSAIGAASAYPFTSCTGMLGNRGVGGGSAWRDCYADWAATQAAADTSAGGYNYP